MAEFEEEANKVK